MRRAQTTRTVVMFDTEQLAQSNHQYHISIIGKTMKKNQVDIRIWNENSFLFLYSMYDDTF